MNPDTAASGPRPVWRTHGARSPWARSEANVSLSQSRLDMSTSPVNSAAPLRPSRRSARSARASPSLDQSSVPSTPKARSAFGPNCSRTRRHASPSPGAWLSSSSALASALRSRNAASPSGKAVAVGCSVFRYSRPSSASSSPSSACAAPPTQSGCQALKTSCRKPGSVISAVLIAPPSASSRSSTHTRQPPRARSAAQASELIPLPTTTASKSATGEVPELLVADETALAGTKLLHPGEHLRAALLGQVEPELFRLDPDRGEAALLAEDDPSLRPDELGGVGLDRRRIVELA